MENTFFQSEPQDIGAHTINMERIIAGLEDGPIPDSPPDVRLSIDACLEPTSWTTLLRNAVAQGIITADAPHRLCGSARRRVLNQRFDAAIRNRAVRIAERLFGDNDVIALSGVFRKFAELVRGDPDIWSVFFRNRRAIQEKLARELIDGSIFTFVVALSILECVGAPFDSIIGAFRHPRRRPARA